MRTRDRSCSAVLVCLVLGCSNHGGSPARDSGVARQAADASRGPGGDASAGGDGAPVDATTLANDAGPAPEAAVDGAGVDGACLAYPSGIELQAVMVGSGYQATVHDPTCDNLFFFRGCCGQILSWHLEKKQPDGTFQGLPEPGSVCGCAAADSWRSSVMAGETATFGFDPPSLGGACGTFRLVARVQHGTAQPVANEELTLTSGEFRVGATNCL